MQQETKGFSHSYEYNFQWIWGAFVRLAILITNQEHWKTKSVEYQLWKGILYIEGNFTSNIHTSSLYIWPQSLWTPVQLQSVCFTTIPEWSLNDKKEHSESSKYKYPHITCLILIFSQFQYLSYELGLVRNKMRGEEERRIDWIFKEVFQTFMVVTKIIFKSHVPAYSIALNLDIYTHLLADV